MQNISYSFLSLVPHQVSTLWRLVVYQELSFYEICHSCQSKSFEKEQMEFIQPKVTPDKACQMVLWAGAAVSQKGPHGRLPVQWNEDRKLTFVPPSCQDED